MTAVQHGLYKSHHRIHIPRIVGLRHGIDIATAIRSRRRRGCRLLWRGWQAVEASQQRKQHHHAPEAVHDVPRTSCDARDSAGERQRMDALYRRAPSAPPEVRWAVVQEQLALAHGRVDAHDDVGRDRAVQAGPQLAIHELECVAATPMTSVVAVAVAATVTVAVAMGLAPSLLLPQH